MIDRFVNISQEVLKEQPVMKTTADIGALLVHFGLGRSVQEELWVVTIDGSRAVRTVVQVGKGGYHDCNISIPTILSPVFLAGTDRFVVAHNHPAGELTPTRIDLELTYTLSEAANLLDLTFEDHLIVVPDGGWYSFRGHGQMARPIRKVAER